MPAPIAPIMARMVADAVTAVAGGGTVPHLAVDPPDRP
jgi:hypothetical protein